MPHRSYMLSLANISLKNLNKTPPLSRTVSLQLNSLRGLSAIIVLIAHSSQIFFAHYFEHLHVIVSLLAAASVMLFFVLSGFLIMLSIARQIHSHGHLNIAAYASARINRIVPPLFMVMIFSYFLWYFAPYVFVDSSRTFTSSSFTSARSGFYMEPISTIGTMTFLNGFITRTVPLNGPLWSLSYEVWYYVILGIGFGMRRFGLFAALALWVSLGALSNTFIVLSIVWFAGALLAIVWVNSIYHRTFAIAGLLFGMFIAAFFIYLYIGEYESGGPLIGYWLLGYQVAVGICFFWVLYLMINGELSINPLFASASDFSYTLYILHFPLLLFVYGMIYDLLTTPIAALAAGLLAAIACLLISAAAGRPLEKLHLIRNSR